MRKSTGKISKVGTKIFAGVLSLAMVVSSLAVTGTISQAKGKVKSVKVTSPVTNGGTLVLKKGQKKQIKVKVTTTKGASNKVTYQTSNAKVAKLVKSKGKYFVKAAAKKGSAKITITSKDNKKKKATLKVKIGVPTKKISIASVKETCTVTRTTARANQKKKKLEESGKDSLPASVLEAINKATEKTTNTTIKVKKNTVTVYTGYEDQSNVDDQQTYSYKYKLNVTSTPKKVGYKAVKWKSSKSSLVTIAPDGTVIIRKKKDLSKEGQYTIGSCNVTAVTKDGTNKKATVKVVVVARPNKYPPEVYDPDTREKIVVEDFESYDVGYNWESDEMKGTAGKATRGKEYVGKNVGKMTVVADPENPKNKVLKVEYNGDTQAYDYAPIFNLSLKKSLEKYTAIGLDSRIVSNSSDCRYKTVYAYFDKYQAITPEYYFATSLKESDLAAKAEAGVTKELIKYSVDASMATGLETKYSVKDANKTFGLADSVDLKRLIYMNKTFPMFFDSWATDKVNINRTYGYKEKESDPSAGWHYNRLELNTGVINNADETLGSQKKVSVVLGSTFSGKYTGGQYLTLYLDNISVYEGEIPLKSMEITPAAKEITAGFYTSINVDDDIAYEPAAATQKELIWESSDSSIVEVNTEKKNPRLYGLKAGTATITATCKANPAIKQSFEITVKDKTTASEDLVVDMSKLIPEKAEDDETTKVFSTITAKYENGVLTLPFTQPDKDVTIIDLGKATDLTQYESVSILGTVTDQITLEIYPDGADFTADKYWTRQVAYATYPFFNGSWAVRAQEGGAYKEKPDDTFAKEDCCFNWIEDKDSTAVHGDLRNARYLVLKDNKWSNALAEHSFVLEKITFKKDRYDKTVGKKTEKELEALGYTKV